MRRLRILAASAWLGVFLSIALFTLFWRIGYCRPHVLWGLLSLVLMFAPLAWLAASILRRMVCGPGRLRAVGWLLVGATPLLWSAAFVTQASLYAYSRTSPAPAYRKPLSVLVTWLSPMLDMEAWRRGLRRTHGRHTVLLDNGRTPSPEKLVAQMDAHIERMAALLGQPVPKQEFPWVRHHLFGIEGMALWSWALCYEGDEAELTSVDRHEMAHALLTTLSGPDQDPPPVLQEGWAESQSGDRTHMIASLAEGHQQRKTCSLREMVHPAVYTRGDGGGGQPVYWEGGPLACFLMEQYGAPTFFQLYSRVRRHSFPEDSRAILGNSWETVEERFWKWIDAEGEAIAHAAAEPGSATSAAPVELADTVDPADWQALVDGYRQANPRRQPIPSAAAFVLEGEQEERQAGADQPSKHRPIEFRAIFEGERFWGFDNFYFVGHECFLMATPEWSLKLHRNDAGGMEGRATHAWPHESALELLGFYQSGADPASLLPLRGGKVPELTYRIERVTRPGEDGRWKVSFTRRSAGVDSGMHQMELAPEQRWMATRLGFDYGSSQYESTTESRYFGDVLMPATRHIHSVNREHELTVHLQTRPMTEIEQRELKQRIEQAGRIGPTLPHAGLRRLLLAIVVVVPLAGASLLAFAPVTHL